MHKSRTFVAHVDPSHQKRHRGTRQTDGKSHRRDQNRSRGDRFVELFDLYPSSGTNPKLHHRGKIRAENFPHFFILFYFFGRKNPPPNCQKFLSFSSLVFLHRNNNNNNNNNNNKRITLRRRPTWTRRIISGKTGFRARRTTTGSSACRKIARRTT